MPHAEGCSYLIALLVTGVALLLILSGIRAEHNFMIKAGVTILFSFYALVSFLQYRLKLMGSQFALAAFVVLICAMPYVLLLDLKNDWYQAAIIFGIAWFLFMRAMILNDREDLMKQPVTSNDEE